ncbi:hypothetical protein [Levilactobacillus mulengensis]|uniref:hypothetical protein n=1 Tax=Levilactobacillus mulengensis TaxID=2486025 RepID=UPI000F785F20|nr:hypothetical protein [Levilactobacillus mulengensis]
MNKWVKGLIVSLASVSFFGVASTIPVHAASKAVALPKSYRGSWYLYGGAETVGKKKAPVFTYARVKLAPKKVTYSICTSTAPTLKKPVWQVSFVAPLIYTKKVAKKTHKVSYRMVLRMTSGTPAITLSKAKVKVKILGKKVPALRVKVSGTKFYAFRQPLPSHSVGDLLE